MMHRRADAGHSMKPGIFVHFARLHGNGKAFCGLPGGPSGKPSPFGCRVGTSHSVPEPVWGAVGGAQRTGRGGGPQSILGPRPDFAPACMRREDPAWQAVVGLRTSLRTWYSPVPVVPHPSCRLVAAAFRELCCGESGSNYLLFLEEDCDTMLESGGIGCLVRGTLWRAPATF